MTITKIILALLSAGLILLVIYAFISAQDPRSPRAQLLDVPIEVWEYAEKQKEEAQLRGSRSALGQTKTYNPDASICANIEAEFDTSKCDRGNSLQSYCEADGYDLSMSQNSEGVFRKISTNYYVSFKGNQACECADTRGKRSGTITGDEVAWTEIESKFSAPYSESSKVVDLWIGEIWRKPLLANTDSQCPGLVQLEIDDSMTHEQVCACDSFVAESDT